MEMVLMVDLVGLAEEVLDGLDKGKAEKDINLEVEEVVVIYGLQQIEILLAEVMEACGEVVEELEHL